ncbi:YqaJ viral recombinase family protein [Microbacterium sp. NPDC080220]|uniref:YqaJ viral recombinase family protein n=1 Tax=Microbacterium sp. NPDC080220 TaxID=3161017 RepID=UPI0034219926
MTMTQHSPVLADLESRAGASDKDRELWLAERRGGVTATEIRDLYLRAITVQDLVDLKLGRKVDTFSGNRYTDWGNAREPIIAAELAGEGFVAESRVIHAVSNSRYLASPDGIRLSFDEEIEIAEIKTAAYDLPPGSPRLAKKGYVAQMQWVMFVLGGVRGRLAVEERIELPDGSFEPGTLHRHWIERDDALIGELVEIADGFLTELDRQRDGDGPVIDEDVDTNALNYLRGLAAEKEGKALKETAYRALVAAGVSQESPLARVTFTPGTASHEFEDIVVDFEEAAAAHPKETAALERAKARVQKLQAEWDALAATHTKTVIATSKGTPARVTVTAGKGTKK